MISFRCSFENKNQGQFIYDKAKNILPVQAIVDIYQSVKQNYSINQFALAIRQYVLKNNCLSLKQKLINFFLKCESKLKEKSDQQWKNIISNQINFFKGFNNLQDAINKISLQKYFNIIVNKDILPIASENNSQKQPILTITDEQIDSIQVTQNVKLKTKFFFKWVQFLQNANNLKQIRLKQIDDLRKSLTFNVYAVKFSYFISWKKITKRTILNRQRFETIELNQKKRLFKNSIQAFYSKFEISKIQNLLVAKIQLTLNKYKTNLFFQKLKQNSHSQKQKETKIVFSNKQAYRFVNIMTQDMVEIKSKTFVNNKNKSQKQFNLCFLRQFFNIFKKLIKEREQKEFVTLLMIKRGFIQKLMNQSIKTQSLSLKSQKLNSAISNKSISHTFTVLKIIWKVNNQSTLQSNLIQSQLCQGYKQNVEQQFKIKQEKQSFKILCALSRISAFKRVFHNITYLHEKKNTQYEKNCLILKLQKLKFFKQLKRRREFKNLIKKNQQSYLENYLLKLVKNSFFKIKDWKSYQSDEKQNLQKIFSILQKKKIQQSFVFLKHFAQRRKAIDLIEIKLNKLFIKRAWNICFQKPIFLLNSINNKSNLKKLSLQRKLFQILKINVLNLNKGKQEVENKKKFNQKLQFINNLKQNYKLCQKIQLMQNYQDINRAKIFLKELIIKKEQIKKLHQKYVVVQKYICFKLFQHKINQTKSKRFENQDKISLIKTNQIKIMLKNSIKNYKINKEIKKTQLQKRIILQKFLIKNILNLMKFNIKNLKQKNKKVIIQKQKQIQKQKTKQFMYFFTMTKKVDKIRQKVKNNQKKYFVTLLFKYKKQKKDQIQLQQTLIKLFKTHSLTSFINISKQQNQRILINSQQIIKLIVKNSFIKFSENKKRGKLLLENHNNYKILYLRRKLRIFSNLMKNCLIKKFSKVKHMCSVKNYAKNIKMRAFKGLKKMLLKIKQKQNRLKTEEQQFKKVEKSYSKLKKQSTLTEVIQNFNMRHSRQVR